MKNDKDIENNKDMENDKKYMKYAISLARNGEGWTSPNPMVGAVIVKDGQIIGEGWHHKYGDLHAERDALKNCTQDPAGATIYVTLEPCCHYGKQPPCVDAIIHAGITRVVMGSGDPNPLVAGKGIQILRDNGIEVVEHVMEAKCKEINEVFLHYITSKIPFVAMKYAMTLDGKIACYTGESRWVTGEKAREHVQMLRNRYRGIMVGINTVLQDNPTLNCRMDGGRDPVRIICDSHLRTPLDSNIVNTAAEYKTIIATTSTDYSKWSLYERKGVEVLNVMTDTLQQQSKELTETEGTTRINIPDLMKILGEKGIDSILLEGGATLNWSMLEAGYVNKVYAYIAPKIFGGADAKSAVGGAGWPLPQDAAKLENMRLIRLENDILVEGTLIQTSRITD